MSRRVIVRAISFIAFAFLVIMAMAFENAERNRRYEQVISNSYDYAFSELLSGITKMDYALEKCAYSSDDSMIASLCSEVFRESDVSSRALSRLPISELSLENTTKFISQAGDYAYYLAKKTARGSGVTDEERSQLISLAEGSMKLMDELNMISSKINKESIDISKVDFLNTEDETLEEIRGLEREFSEYPILIYDGPFSDETEGENKFLAGLQKITDDEAVKICSELFGSAKEELKVDSTRTEDGIELLSITDGESYFDITRLGGVCFRVMSSRKVKASVISVDEAIDSAKKLLLKIGYKNLEETYYMRYGNTLSVNFAEKQGETIIYPDLVKVTISLEDGRVINFDAAGYIKNHKERDIKNIAEDSGWAKERVSKELRILSWTPAVIPTDGSGEILTHEFKCETKDGKHCIVYINAETLYEEKILILIESENGTLVM